MTSAVKRPQSGSPAASKSSAIGAVARQFIQFAGVGVIGTAGHYMVLITIMEVVHGEAIIASSIGALTGAAINYILNYRFTFASDKRHVEALTKFLIIAGIGFLLNGLLMGILVYQVGWPYIIAQLVVTAVLLIWNFVGNRCWTFAT